MTYNSVAEIFEQIDEIRQRLCSRVEGLSDEQANARPAPEAWSVSEILEHLSIIETLMVRNIRGMLAKTEAVGRAGDGGPVKMRPFSMERFVERARGEKYTAPEMARPTGKVPLADSLARLRRTREELRNLQPRMEAADLSEAKFPHPAFGPLDAYQWLAFVGLHEGRHLRQIESVLSA